MAEGAMAKAILALVPQLDNNAKKDIENDVADAGEKASGRFKTALSTAGKLAAASIAAAIAGLGKVAKDAFAEFADFQQLEGGVKKLFDEESGAAAIVFQSAQDAWRTAGLTANQYMEQVTGFSASLISSLGGDTVEAAKLADVAIRAMSDNANTFGTDIASIQAAYQGFAKGNYTMLDNLRLGYSGTASEAARLLTDAEKLDSTFTAQRDSTGELTMSYADMIRAIQIVQTEMGIAETTVNEAGETISGAAGAVKASWGNLLVGFASDEAALGGLVETFIGNVVTFAQNALPRLTIIVESIGEMLPTMVDMVIGFISTDILPLFESLISTILAHIPDFVQAGVNLLISLVKDLPGIINTVVKAIPDIVDSLVDTLLDPANLAMFVQAGIDLMLGLGKGILEAIPRLIQSAIKGIGNIVQAIKNFLGIKSPSKLFAEIGDYCMQGLGEGFEDGTAEAAQAAQSAVSDVTDAAQAQARIGVSAGLTGATGGNSSIVINSVTIQADRTTTAEEIFGKIRMAAAMA